MPEKSDHDILIEVHSSLMGANGQGGLCRQVERNTRSINKIWICLAFIAAGTGGGAWAIVSKLIGG